MTHSYAEHTDVECSVCDATRTVDTWLVVDETERPDLLARIREGGLHRVVCPVCHENLGEFDAPVVLYRPSREPAVLFLPAKETTNEQDHEDAIGLLTLLRDRLGDAWRDEWLTSLNHCSQELARFVLADEAAGFELAEVGTLAEATLELVNAASWDDVRLIVESNQALLSPLADRMMAQLAADQVDAAASILVEQDRAFLGRCAELGLDVALVEWSDVDRSQPEPGAVVEAPPSDDAVERERALVHRIIEAEPDGPVAEAAWILARAGEGADFLRARRLLDRDTLPNTWLAATLAAAETMVYRSTGDRAADVERALELCAEGEQIVDRARSPRMWAMLYSIMGEAFQHRSRGDWADNVDRAIECAEAALEVRTRATMPVEWAGTQHNLGVAYLERVHGDRADNVETAIACLRRALEIRTRDDHPKTWADSQTSLGNAYLGRIYDSEAENIEQAIACYERAVAVLSNDRDPVSWGHAVNGLGNAHRIRVLGDPDDNIEQATRCYQRILDALTVEEHPLIWANAQVNLGNLYRDERAVQHYENALRVYTKESYPKNWAAVQINLGVAHGRRNTEDAVLALERAAEVYDHETYPERWAAVHRNMAVVGAGQEHLELALTVYTPDAFPADHRLLAGELGDVHFAAGRWQDAHARYDTAIAASEAIYQAAASDVGRHAELAETSDIVLSDAYCLARLGHLGAAVERLEHGRARALAEALAHDRADLAAAAPEDRYAFEAARARIRGLEAARDDRLTERVAALGAARRELAAVVDRIREYQPTFLAAGLGIDAIAAVTDEPLVYLITTGRGGLALIVPPGGTPDCLLLDQFTTNDLWDLLRGTNYLVGQLTGDMPTLRAALDQVLPVLADRVMNPLVARLADLGFDRATMIPGGRLSLLPLHAVAVDTITVTYTPSAMVRREAQVNSTQRDGLPIRLLAFADPESLPFARLEVDALDDLVPSSRLLIGTHPNRAALAYSTHIHCACHGIYRFDQPLESGLVLGDERWLTLAMLMDEVALPAARLVVLSACQTAITDIRDVPDEAIGLPAGFLHVGVPCVVSTLWSVEDLSTALLMARFYHLHLAGEGVALALRRAQAWLRDATARELASHCEEIYRTADVAIHRAIRYLRAVPNERPFAHPVYWAAFTVSGAPAMTKAAQ